MFGSWLLLELDCLTTLGSCRPLLESTLGTGWGFFSRMSCQALLPRTSEWTIITAAVSEDPPRVEPPHWSPMSVTYLPFPSKKIPL